MKRHACRGAGVDCDHVVSGETVDEVMQKAGEHGKQVHGYADADSTPEMMEKMKSLIKNE